MQFDEYQGLANRTSSFNDTDYTREHIMLGAMGLAGEVGEVVDLLKKAIFHKHKLDYMKLEEELGDVLWYLAELCTATRIKLSDVATINIEKLKQRYPQGFSSEASINREDIV